MYIYNFIMEQSKLQCFCSLEPKDASGLSKIKNKLEYFLDEALISSEQIYCLKIYDQLISI